MYGLRFVALGCALILSACYTNTYVDLGNHSGRWVAAYSSHSKKRIKIKDGHRGLLPHTEGMVYVTTDDGRERRFDVSIRERSTREGQMLLNYRVDIDSELNVHKQSLEAPLLVRGAQDGVGNCHESHVAGQR